MAPNMISNMTPNMTPNPPSMFGGRLTIFIFLVLKMTFIITHNTLTDDLTISIMETLEFEIIMNF